MQTDGYEYAICVHIKLEFLMRIQLKIRKEILLLVNIIYIYFFLLLCLTFHYVLKQVL